MLELDTLRHVPANDGVRLAHFIMHSPTSTHTGPGEGEDTHAPVGPRRRWIVVGVAAAGCLLAATAGAWSGADLSAGAVATLAVFVVMGVLWVGGAFPAFAVGLLGLGGLFVTLSAPWGVVPHIEWHAFAAEFVSTPMVMTLAGMMLALGAQTTGVDGVIAARLLGPLVHRPGALMLMVIAVGAGMSMLMSNTATAVLLLALIMPLVRPLGERSSGARALVMAAALGAAVGGLVTPIGTPPNLIIFGQLRERGIPISFLEWIARGLPLAAGALFIGWLCLRRLAGGFAGWKWEGAATDHARPGWRGVAWAIIFVVTIGLWISQPWSGIPVGVSSVLPMATLPILGVLTPDDLRRIDWATLLLMGSGLCLGHAMGETGLASWIVSATVPTDAAPWIVVAAFALLAVGLSTFMSNTATANVLAALCFALPRPELIVSCGMAIAFASSLAVGLPVSTPPVLLATSTGFVRTGELLRMGLLIALGGVALTVVVVLV